MKPQVEATAQAESFWDRVSGVEGAGGVAQVLHSTSRFEPLSSLADAGEAMGTLTETSTDSAGCVEACMKGGGLKDMKFCCKF